MEVAICTMVGLLVGYLIGMLQGGIHININNGHRPLVSSDGKEPQYNEDYSHLLPPEMQEYYLKNNGQMK